MAFIWLWSEEPLVLLAGSSPSGQSPAKPALSRTTKDPPALGAPVVADDVEDDAADDEDDDEDDLELPHALINAAMTNRQAAIRASLLGRMASIIRALLASCKALWAGAASGQRASSA